MKWWVILWMTVVINEGCVTQQRCLEKFPPETTTSTTTVTRDTSVFVPGRETDTVFIAVPGDTVTVVDTLTQIKIRMVKRPGDTVFVSVDCPGDTVFLPGVIRETEINKTQHHIVRPKPFPWWILLSIATVLFGLGYMINSFKK